MAAATEEARSKAMRRYARLDAEFTAAGGYAAESEAASIAAARAHREATRDQEIGTSPAASAAGSNSRILFSAETPLLLMNRPTTRCRLDRLASGLPQGLPGVA